MKMNRTVHTGPTMNWRAMFISSVLLLGGFMSMEVTAVPQQANAPTPLQRVQQITPQAPATIPGQSATLLPDGHWLLAGGLTKNNTVSNRLFLVDAATSATTQLSTTLLTARAGHTATVLPDGTVLIIGGIGQSGQVAKVAERFDPVAQNIVPMEQLTLLPRSEHTANLQTDGSVLVAGGVGANGQVLDEAELLDTMDWTVTVLPHGLNHARYSQSSALLPSEDTLVAGGLNQANQPVAAGELYLPESAGFVPLASVPNYIFPAMPAATIPPLVEAVLPVDGSTGIDVNTRFALRFSKPMPPSTINGSTVTLLGSSGKVDSNVVAAEGGMLAFLTPNRSLLPGSSYTLFVQGVLDKESRPLPFSAYHYETAPLAAPAPSNYSGPALGSGDIWTPGPGNYNGNWRSGNSGNASRTPSSQLLSSQGVPTKDGKPALAGRVLKLDGSPLKNVTLSVGNKQTTTNKNGEFLLNDLAAGANVLVIDGFTASQGSHQYGRYEYHAVLADKVINVLPFTVWMTALDVKHEEGVPSPTAQEVVVTNPGIPGLELHIPAGTVIRDDAGKLVTRISMTPIPVDQPPFPLPQGISVPVYFTIQPGGAHFQSLSANTPQGATLVYPNFAKAPPGTSVDFWNYDPVTKGWYVYGQGKVTADGKQIKPNPGVVIYELTGAMVGSGGTPPPPPTIQDPTSCNKSPPPPSGSENAGDPVDCYTGIFKHERTDLVVKDIIPVSVGRSYRSQDPAARAFGVGSNLDYDMYLIGSIGTTGDLYPWMEVILPDESRIYYKRTSGSNYDDVIETCTTGRPDTTTQIFLCPQRYVGSTIRYVTVNSQWVLQMKDGSSYIFPDSSGGTNARTAAVIGYQDRNGNRLTLTRDIYGNLKRISGPTGRGINFTYASSGTSSRITQASDDTGRMVTYAYYGDTGAPSGSCTGCLWKVTDPDGHDETYTYDSSDNMLTVTDKRGNVMVTNSYDANQRVHLQTYPDTRTFQFDYTTDGNGRVTQTTETDENSNVKVVEFDDKGFPLKVTNASGSSDQQVVTLVRDPTTGLTTSMTDAMGRTTTYQYDSNGNTTQVTLDSSGLAQVWKYSYDPMTNQVLTITDPLNHVTTLTVDGSGNVTSATDPLGHSVSVTYNSFGQVASVTRTVDSVAMTTSYSYSGADLMTVTDPLGHVTRYMHDPLGRIQSITDAAGNTTMVTHDSLDHVTEVTDPLNNSIAATYDNNGNLSSFTDSKGHTTSYTYDTRNRVLSRTDPYSAVESYSYDAIGNLVQLTDRNGKVSGFTYDHLDRRITAGYGATTGSPTSYTNTAAYNWDAGNRMTGASDQTGTINRVFDNLDRLTQESGPTGTINYTYYANNLRNTMTVTGQGAVSYSYYDNNQLEAITQGSDSVGFTYDTANRRSTLTLPSGIVATYTYDNASELTGITYKNGTTTVGDLTYGYNNLGQRASQGGTLLQVDLPGTSTSSYDNANRLENLGPYIMAYDNNGQLDTVSTFWGDAVLGYDGRNRLSQQQDSGTTVATYTYDALGRRINKTLGGVSTNMLYDGWQVVQELNGTTPTANLLTGPGLDEIFRRTTTSANSQNPSVTNDYLTDALHSTLALTNASGTIQTTYSYEPYGSASVYGTATDNTYEYTGHEDDGTGLYNYRHRYTVGGATAFTSEDPMGFAAGQNLYAYVGGNPIKRRDPKGNLWEEIPIGLVDILQDLLVDQATDVANDAMLNTGGLACDTLDCNPLPPEPPPNPPNVPWCSHPPPSLFEGSPITPKPTLENMPPPAQPSPPQRPLIDWDVIFD